MAKYKIDASGKILGRLATEIAVLLRGKNKPDFLPYKDEGGEVEVSNIDKIKVTANKENDKFYWRYSGYPGGIRKRSYRQLSARDSAEPLRRAVYGMLSKNKLRDKMIKRLIIK